MSLLNRLISQLEKRGLSIAAGNDPGTLLLCGPDHEKTPDILATVKEFKPQLLERYGKNVQHRQAEQVRSEATSAGLVEVEDD